MKKKGMLIGIIIAILLLAILLLLFFKPSKKKEEIKELESTGTIAGVDYELCTDFSSGKKYEMAGYYIDTLNTPNVPYWYFITSGEKGTGGYSIKIVDLKIDENLNAEVTVEETNPEEGALVTEAFTYPTTCLKVNKPFNSIVVKNTSGYTYEKLN